MRPFGTCTSDGPADFTGRLSQPPIDPWARLDGIKSYHVVKFEKDGRGVDRLIAENLRRRGYQVTEGPTPAGGVDTVSVQAADGQETGALDTSNVSNAELKAAIESSITRSNLFRSVVQGRGGDYDLTVTVTQLSKPMFGGAFTVSMETGWSLVRASDRSVVMRKAIKSSHTARWSDSVVGVTRLRMALEGAVRKNIEEGLKSISELPL